MAIKITDKTSEGSSPVQWGHLRREAAALYRCRHPSLIKCIEFHETADIMFMVTEFCAGGDLQSSMEMHGLLALDEDRIHEIAV